jgi:hypothetical protein
MPPSRTRAAAALLAALAAGGSAAAQDLGHTFTIAPLALRTQTGEASFTATNYFSVLGIDGEVPAPPTPYTFASVTGPSGVPVALSPSSPNVFTAQQQFGSLEALRAAYPGGAYSGAIGPGGPVLPTLTLPNDYTLPVSPAFTNYTAIQGFDPQQSFTFTFTPFTGAGGSDFTRFSIIDSLTSGTVVNEALDPSETQFVLPAGTLTAGRSYAATVYFPQTVDLQVTIPGDLSGIHIGQANLVSATFVNLTPVPEPAALVLVAAAALGGLAMRRTRRGRCPARPAGAGVR